MKATAILQLLPVITSAITIVEEVGVEQSDPTLSKSATKLAAAKQIIQAAYESTHPTVAFSELVGAIEKIIAAFVAFYNLKGIFTKKTSS